LSGDVALIAMSSQSKPQAGQVAKSGGTKWLVDFIGIEFCHSLRFRCTF